MKMKLVKPIVAVGAASLLALTAACSSGAGGDTPKPTPTSTESVEQQLKDIPRYDLTEFFNQKNPAEKGKVFAMLVIDLSTDPFAEQVEDAKVYAKQLGWDLRVADLKGQVGQAGATLKTLVEAGADVILSTSMGPDLIGRDALAVAHEAGVIVMSQTSGVKASESKGAFDSSVESPLLDQGRIVGERMLKEVPEGSKIGLLFDQQAASGRGLEEGFRKAVGDKYQIVAEKQYDYAKGVPGAAADANAMMQAHPDIAAFWCPYDGPCSGVANAVASSGKKVKIFSKGGYPAFLDYIRKGVAGYTLAEPNTVKILQGFDQAVTLTRGDKVKSTDITLDLGGMITPDNIGQAAEIADGTVSYGPGLADGFYKRWGVKK